MLARSPVMALRADLPIGSDLLGYRIEAVVGAGSMGVVYLAEDRRLKRRVALKLLSRELAGVERFRDQLLTESELAASLDHPNIIPIYAVGEADDRIFISMRYVEGHDLAAVLSDGPLAPDRALSIVSQIAGALDAAHDGGLVHGDVKPSNVLVAPGAGRDGEDHVYLADFGLSRRLATVEAADADNRLLGTLGYVAPEQIRGDGVDGRADVYSLGCVLYECLAGTPAFGYRSDAALLFAHLNEAPPALTFVRGELPSGIDAVVRTALAKDPDDRFATARELVDAARSALGLERPRRSRLRPVLAVALLLLLGTGAAALSVERRPDDRIDP